MSTVSLFLLSGLVLLAGCASVQTPTITHTSTPTVEAPSFWNLTANDCASMVARAEYPLDSAPGNRPAGWGRSEGVATAVEMSFYSCKRVSIGGLERPTKLMLETHSNLDPPPMCAKGEWNTYRVLHAVWTNDTDLAALLATKWEITVHVVDLQQEQSQAAQTWNWQENQLQAANATTGETEISTNLRYAWGVGDGVRFVDIAKQSSSPQYQLPLITGHVTAPLLAAERSETFVGEGGLTLRSTLEAKLSRFGDALCGSPLPS